MASTVTLTGRIVLPGDAAPDSAQIRLQLTGTDTDQITREALPAGGQIVIDLDDGDVPAGTVIWRNTSGLAGSSYNIYLTYTDADGRGQSRLLADRRTVGEEDAYDLSDLIDAGVAAAAGTYVRAITAAQYNAAISARDEAQGWSAVSEQAAGQAQIAQQDAETARDEAQGYAQTPEDTTVPGGAGYSALHYAAKAGADATATASDRVQTGLDRTATGLDRTATAADRVQTGLDRTATGLDRTATAADRVQTGLDATATASDRVQTGLDREAAAASAASAALYGPLTFPSAAAFFDAAVPGDIGKRSGSQNRFAWDISAPGTGIFDHPVSGQGVTPADGLNVAEFGTLGGVDDTATWQRAADYVKMFGPRPLVAPPGRYNIGSVDFDNADVTLLMPGVTIAPLPAANKALMFQGGRVLIEGLSVDADNSFAGVDYGLHFDQCDSVTLLGLDFLKGYYGAFMDRCERVHVERCHGDGARGWHIYSRGAQELVYALNSMHNGAFDGLKAGGVVSAPWVGLESAVIVGNIAQGCGRDGIDLAMNMSARVLIYGNVSRDNGLQGIDYKSVYGTSGEVGRVKIFGNYHEVEQASSEGVGTGGFGVHLQGSSAPNIPVNWAEVHDNTAVSRNPSVSTAAAVMLSNAHHVWSHHNRSHNYFAGHRLLTGASDCIIEDNREENALSPVTIDNTGGGVPSRNIIRRNWLNRRDGQASACVTVASAAVDTQIYDNDFACDNTGYSISDAGTGTLIGKNYRGWSDGLPTGQRGFIGDTWRQKSPAAGMPEEWTAVASSSSMSAANCFGMSQRGYRQGSGSPVGSVTPQFVGEIYLQTGTTKWWRSFGMSAGNWA